MRFTALTPLACLAALLAAPLEAEESIVNQLLERVQPVLSGVDGAALFPSPPEATGPPLSLDLTQCVATALRDNARAQAAGEDVLAREAQIGQARAAKRPQITGQLAYAYVEGLERPVNPPRIVDRIIGFDGLDANKSTLIAQVSLQQVLYGGGKIQAAIRASEHLAASEGWRREATLDDLEQEVKQAYYDCLLSLALIEVARESVRTFQRHLADAESMLEAGLLSRFEVLRAGTELGARETDLDSARAASDLAFLNLRRLLGIEEHRAIQLTGELAWRPMGEPVEDLIAQALAARPELRALDGAIAAAGERVNIARGDYRPTLGAQVQYQEIVGGPELAPDGVMVVLRGEYAFYTGGRRKHEVLEAQARRRSLERQRADVARLVDLDVRQADIRVREAVEIIRREKGTVALAEEGLRLAELRFQEGVGTAGDTLNAELAYTQARTSLAQALRNYAVAMAALDRAVVRRLIPRDPAPGE